MNVSLIFEVCTIDSKLIILEKSDLEEYDSTSKKGTGTSSKVGFLDKE